CHTSVNVPMRPSAATPPRTILRRLRCGGLARGRRVGGVRAGGAGGGSVAGDDGGDAAPCGLAGCTIAPPWATAAKAAANSVTEGNRSSGVFASARSTTWASPAGSPGWSTSSGGGGSKQCCLMISTVVNPLNGRWPLSIWYAMTPREYWSDAPVTDYFLAHCSGEM